MLTLQEESAMGIKDFLSKLVSVYPVHPDREGLKEYVKVLNRWNDAGFAEDQLAKLYDKLIMECLYFPTIYDLYRFAYKLNFTVSKPLEDPHFLMFEFDGGTYSIPIRDLSKVPDAPEGAINVRIVKSAINKQTAL